MYIYRYYATRIFEFMVDLAYNSRKYLAQLLKLHFPKEHCIFASFGLKL